MPPGDEELIRAAELVCADGFIRALPHGYDTVLTEGGAMLSQGEKQLLALARTMASDPKILILDEATSSVDTKTERELQEGVNRMLKGRTSFIVAHRLSIPPCLQQNHVPRPRRDRGMRNP